MAAWFRLVMRNVKTLKAPLLLTLLASVQEGCALPGPSVDLASMDNLERLSFSAASAAGSTLTLSALRTTPTTPAEAELGARGRVIYVHGTPGDANGWLDYLDQPVAGWEAVATDRPGFGLSEPNGPVESLEDQARALEPLLKHRDGRWPILVGHSLGGPIVAKAAALFPDRVGGIVIAAGALDPELEKVMWLQHVGDTWLISWILPRWARNSNRELIELKDELRTLQNQLSQIDCPIVVIHGTHDTLVPYANVAFMRDQFAGLPDVEFVTLERGNHFLIWNQQSLVRDAIRRAIELQEARIQAPASP